MEVVQVERRRLAAILAADIVGYSRLVEKDERGTLAAIRKLRTEVIDPLLARHHGRLVKLMGDGAIVEFGSVVDAVSCAVALQKDVKAAQTQVAAEQRIVFRMGVNLGDVVVEGDDLLGDGVNVAARLEQLCPPGGVLVSGTAYDHLQGRLGLPLDFVGEQQVKNIARPVRTYRVRIDGSKPRWRLWLRRRRLAPAVGVIVAAMAGAGLWWWLNPAPMKAVPPSIAVLPFANLGGDEATGRLADGITEDIITDLARFRELAVIARHSVEVYKGKPVDVRQIGKELRVGYVLEGSIQRQAESFRVTAQLTETGGGAHLWSERWDRPATDIFAVQTEVADRVAGTLGGAGVLLNQSRAAAKRKRPSDLHAYDLYALASEKFSTGLAEGNEQGIKYLDEAIGRDPGFARAYVLKAWLTWELVKFHKRDFVATLTEMEQLARKALAIDPYDADAHVLLSWVIGSPERLDEALAEADMAMQLNPNSTDGLVILADTLVGYGRPEESVNRPGFAGGSNS
jgi:TolB-like protein/class 3 adenylate cyclase